MAKPLVFTGKVKNIDLPVTPSLVMVEGDLLTFTTGLLTKATAGTAAVDIVGMAGKTIATTDTAYSDTRLIPVRIPMERHAEVRMSVGTGTLATTSVGLEF